MTPLQHPKEFSTIVLGSARSPGGVSLSGHDRDLKWDVEEAEGQTGASSQLVGSTIGEFQASFFLASSEDQIAWPAFQRVLESTFRGAEPKALPIYHPDLAANRYTEVCVSSIGGAVRDERGGVTILVKFIEFRPPAPKPAKPAGGSGGGSSAGGAGGAGGGTGTEDDYDPNKERREELDALLEEAAEA